MLANLLRNAIVHTPPGTPIEVAVERDGGGACFTVQLPAAALSAA